MSFYAGQSFTFDIELPWKKENITKDFSVTAWAQSEAVAVEHELGYSSDSLPLVGQEASS